METITEETNGVEDSHWSENGHEKFFRGLLKIIKTKHYTI